MPELPEIYNLAKQMDLELRGQTIRGVEVVQEKCLNMSVDQFTKLVVGRQIESVTSRGKWVFARLSDGAWLLLSLGMGGDALLHRDSESLPGKYQARLDLDGGRVLTVGFWWFGYLHAAMDGDLCNHKMTAKLGPTPIRDTDFTEARFLEMLRGKRGSVKGFLLNQEQVAGIGNVYVQDTLFRARLQPNRKLESLAEGERSQLFRGLMETLIQSVRLGGLAGEKDLYGCSGRFKEFLVGYREGQPCPECGTLVEKVKVGSTASYVCPSCQK